MAIEHDIGCIVVDNFYEIELIGNLLKRYNKEIDVLMRVTPGVESETHHYIMTGNEDSKFGFSIHNGQADQAFEMLYNHSQIQFKGLHCHIGSQIFGTKGYIKAIEILFDKLDEWHNNVGFVPDVLNLGGGFGIRYTIDDDPLPLENYVEAMVSYVKKHADQINIPMPEIWIEPGRAIAGNAGITLYTI